MIIFIRIATTKDNYKFDVDLHKQLQGTRLEMMWWFECIQAGSHWKFECIQGGSTGNFLHSRCMGQYKVLRRFGFNLSKLEESLRVWKDQIFNVKDLISYHTPADILLFLIHIPQFLQVNSHFQISSHLHLQFIHKHIKIPHLGDWGILKDEIASTADREYQRYLVHWRGRLVRTPNYMIFEP